MNTFSIPSVNPSKKQPAALQMPAFPRCDDAMFGCLRGLQAMSVIRILQHTASPSYLKKQFKKHADRFGLFRNHATHVWHTQQWEVLSEPDANPSWHVPWSTLPDLAMWCSRKTRMFKQRKLNLLQKLNVNPPPEEMKVPIEHECLELLAQTCPYALELQYRLGKYRLDAFIPRMRLAIQIDEHGHRSYNETEERKLEECVRDAGMVLFRFNPHATYAYPPAVQLCRELWQRTLSPDFITFRQDRKLC